jgi:hypothetical protein
MLYQTRGIRASSSRYLVGDVIGLPRIRVLSGSLLLNSECKRSGTKAQSVDRERIRPGRPSGLGGLSRSGQVRRADRARRSRESGRIEPLWPGPCFDRCWFRISDFGLRIADFWLLVTVYWLPVTSYRLPVYGCWLLVAACCLLVAGCWLPVVGCWLPPRDRHRSLTRAFPDCCPSPAAPAFEVIERSKRHHAKLP